MKVLIAGYYGFGNLGDELILGTIISQLQSRYSRLEVTVLSQHPKDTFRTHQVRAVSRWNPLSIVHHLWRNDFLILGGGGLLQNKTSEFSLFYYLGLVALARIFQTPVVLYAMGVETLNGKLAQWLTRLILSSRAITITVRDEGSKKMLMDIGLREKSIYLTADPVFARSMDVAMPERYPVKSFAALLIPRFPCPAAGRKIFSNLTRIFRLEKMFKVEGLLFEPRSETQYLQDFAGQPFLTEEDFISGLSMESIVKSVTSYDVVVSARYHGLVLATLAGRPFIGVGDKNKVGRICEQFGMPFLPWNADDLSIQKAVEAVLKRKYDTSVNLVEQLRSAALQTADHVR